MEEPEKKSDMEKAVLPPDHPLLQRFQEALREHLLAQISRVKEDIYLYESDVKKKNDEKDALGMQTYENQQIVCKQQKVLENIVKELETVSASKDEIDHVLKEKKKEHKELQEKYIQSEKTNRELYTEIEAVTFLNQQMQHWEEKIESQISVNMRISSKARIDKIEAAKAKRDQDLLLYVLNKEIWRLESEVEDLALQIKLKENELEELMKTVALGNTNTEAIQAENRCLMHSWNGVVVAISHRDKGLECLNEQLMKLQEKSKNTANAIEQVKKLIKKEQLENEKLEMLKARVEEDSKNCAVQLESALNKKNALDKEIYELQVILEQTEKDIELCKVENLHLEKVSNSLLMEYEKVYQRKFEMEKELLESVDSTSNSDKLARVLIKTLYQVAVKRRDVEVILHESENKFSLISTKIQEQKFRNEEKATYLDEVHRQQMELHKEADRLQSERETQELIFKKRERQIHFLVNQLEKVANEKKEVTSPQELKLLELEKGIDDCQDTIRKLQTFWLREQKYLLDISTERQEQITEMNLLKKQNMILESKNLKLSRDLENHQKNQEKIMKTINNLQNKGVMICEDIFKKRNQKNDLDRNNILMQTQYDSKLKDAELLVLTIEAEITDIEEDKVVLSKEIIEVNREVLEWEKRLQMIKEAVTTMKEERCSGGEVKNMTQEIHKMEVIYAQMKKAQEKLIKDLTHCISRRDEIYFSAEAKSKKQTQCKKGVDKTRVNYLRKMDEVKNKIKKAQNEIKQAISKIQAIEKDCQKCKDDKIEAEKAVEELKKYAKKVYNDLEEAKTNRQLKFEMLLIKQKKLSMYHHLSLKRTPYTIYKKEEQLSSEYKKQKHLNDTLSVIIGNLMSDFPNRIQELNRMNNTLKISLMSMHRDL